MQAIMMNGLGSPALVPSIGKSVKVGIKPSTHLISKLSAPFLSTPSGAPTALLEDRSVKGKLVMSVS